MATDLRGKTALVTGASSGIGAAFARQLAARGANLIVVARRQAELEALATAVRAAHQVEVTVIALDLATPTAAAALFARTEGAGRTVDVLINNAGFGEHQYFVEQAWDRVAQQLQLNIVTLTELSHRFGQAMAARGRGHLLNVASIGAYTPAPTYATYAAGKAYVRDFTEAIAHELAPRGVRVCSVCPGLTTTEFHQVAGQTLPGWMKRFGSMTADRCAAIGLAALFGWRRNVVTGVSNKIGMWMLRFVPRRMIVWIAARSMGQPRLAAGKQALIGGARIVGSTTMRHLGLAAVVLIACGAHAEPGRANPATLGEAQPFDRSAVTVPQTFDPAEAGSIAGGRVLTRVAQVERSLVDSTYQPRTQVDERAGTYRWDCSGMTTWLLKRSAPRARAAIASARPVARDYYRAIARAPIGKSRGGWQRLAHVAHARPGDLFAFLRSPVSTSKITGHVGVIVGRPVELPGWPGAFAVRIADSTRGGHGDDPRANDLDGGFGIGTMLFVTDAGGVVTHYGWIGLDSPWLMPTTVLFGRVTG